MQKEGEKALRVIVAHPGKQHSYRLASALKKEGCLDCYVTTIYNKEKSIFMKFIKIFLSKENKKRANNRKNKDLNDFDVIQFCRLRGVVEAFLSRFSKLRKFYNFWQKRSSDKFGAKVAKLAIKRDVDIVIMYDTTALKCFEILKKRAPHIKRILDVSIATKMYRKHIYAEEIVRNPESKLKIHNIDLWNEKNILRYKRELELSDIFLVASKFVEKSLLFCGVNDDKIKIVPYGANLSISNGEDKNNSGILRILFVGQVNHRKGVPYLLKAVSLLDKNKVELILVGAYNRAEDFVVQYKNFSNIHFLGAVTFDKMQAIYKQADIFVIDSFAEGMAQVGIEAMACGLPIICSSNSGVNDLVTDNKNGFVIPPGDVESLRTKIEWFLKNRDKIKVMGENARDVGNKYTWRLYEKNVVTTLKDIYHEGR